MYVEVRLEKWLDHVATVVVGPSWFHIQVNLWVLPTLYLLLSCSEAIQSGKLLWEIYKDFVSVE